MFGLTKYKYSSYDRSLGKTYVKEMFELILGP